MGVKMFWLLGLLHMRAMKVKDRNTKKRILITGIGGFIGSHLAKLMLADCFIGSRE